MTTLDDILEKLPDRDLQIRRMGKRRTFPCPQCGEIVPGCCAIAASPKKPLELGISIPCPRCGQFTVVSAEDGESSIVVETGAAYDSFSRVKASRDRLDRLSKNADRKDPEQLLELAEAAVQEAEEVEAASPDKEALWVPYLIAVSSYCALIESGRTDLVETLARLTLRCNAISKYELLAQLKLAYELIEKHQECIPRALLLKMRIEHALVVSAFVNGRAMSEKEQDDSYYDKISAYAEEFDSLPAEEKAAFPYVAADGWNYILTKLARSKGKGVEAAAEKVVTEIRKARKSGAPEDRAHLMMAVSAYRLMASDSEKARKDMIADAESWTDPLFLAMADFTLAEHVYAEIVMECGYDAGLLPGEVVAETVRKLSEAISILEKMDNLDGFAVYLPESHSYRGVITRDSRDKELACRYAIYFANIGLADDRDVRSMLMSAAVTEELGSPLQDWAMKMLGVPL